MDFGLIFFKSSETEG